MAEKQTKLCQFLIWRIPRALKKRFKLKCMRLDITMRDQVIKMMRKFVEGRS